MLRTYLEAFFPAARAAGIGKMRFYIKRTRSRTVSVFRAEPEQMVQAEECALLIEGEVDGLCGSAAVGDLRPQSCEEAVRLIRESALERKLPFVPLDLPNLPDPGEETAALLPLPELLSRLTAAEQAAYDADGRVSLVHGCGFSERWGRVTLADDTGRSVTDLESGGHFHISLSARQGNQVQMGGRSRPLHLGDYPDMEGLARQAASEAVEMLGAAPYPTCHSPAVLDSRVVCELLDAFLPAFFAKNVHSRTSVLAGKLGQRIAGDLTVLEEDPLLPEGLSRRRFDDEGVPTTAKTILSGGILRTYLCDRQSAAWCGLAPGGNGFRPSAGEDVGTGYTNLILRPGDRSRAQLLSAMGSGLLITGVSGVFAGASPTSGDFSLISHGQRVLDGRPCGAVNQITIAGNFFELLRQTLGVGNDGTWMRSGGGCLCAPSLYAASLAVSGGGGR